MALIAAESVCPIASPCCSLAAILALESVFPRLVFTNLALAMFARLAACFLSDFEEPPFLLNSVWSIHFDFL
jgi:hypothetical protein